MSASVETALRDRQKFASSHSDIPYVVALKIKSSHQWSSLKKFPKFLGKTPVTESLF